MATPLSTCSIEMSSNAEEITKKVYQKVRQSMENNTNFTVGTDIQAPEEHPEIKVTEPQVKAT